MISVVACTPNLLWEIEPIPGQIAEVGVLQHHLEGALAFLIDGRPIAAGGIFEIWDRVGEAWAVLSQESLEEHGYSMTMALRRHLAEMMLEKFGRIYMYGAVDNPKMLDWTESLGFEKEGVLKNFGPGAVGDFYVFGRVN